MKLALVVPEYRTDRGGDGGVASVADFLLRDLRQRGHKLDIISPRMSRFARESRALGRPTSWWRGPEVRLVVREGENVRYVGASVAEVEPVRFLPRRVLDLAVSGYDGIIVVAGSPALCYALKNAKRPIVLQVATMMLDERVALLQSVAGVRRAYRGLMAKIGGAIDERGLMIADAVVVENEVMYRKCVERGVENVTLVAPGVDVDRFRPGDPAENRYVITVGRLDDPRKDVASLLRAFAIAKRSPGFAHNLVLAGRRPPTKQVVELIADLGLSSSVSVISPAPESALPLLLRQADLFVSSSTEEGLGMAAIEAMASGVPVLATRTDGLSHVIGNSGAGVFVDTGPGLADRLAKSMQEVLADSAVRQVMGQCARTRAVEEFSAASVGDRFDRIIQQTVKISSSGRASRRRRGPTWRSGSAHRVRQP